MRGGSGPDPLGVPGQVCDGPVCITCSDQAVAVPVVALVDGGLALVDAGGHEEQVSVALVTAAVGDTVLVHAGEALAVVARGSATR